jgi:hypothetical protein
LNLGGNNLPQPKPAAESDADAACNNKLLVGSGEYSSAARGVGLKFLRRKGKRLVDVRHILPIQTSADPMDHGLKNDGPGVLSVSALEGQWKYHMGSA